MMQISRAIILNPCGHFEIFHVILPLTVIYGRSECGAKTLHYLENESMQIFDGAGEPIADHRLTRPCAGLIG